MKRVVLILAVFGILCLASSLAQANGPHGSHGYHGHPGYHHGYYAAPRTVYRPVYVGVPRYAPAPVYYGPACYPGYYTPYPSVGVYYRSRGLSLGIGF